MPTPDRAQSSLQFFLRFRESGGSSRELVVLRDAYLLAMELNTGLVTGGGKPTLTHNVGAASLALHYGAPFDVIAAAMLHDAYLVGDFGRVHRRASEAKRAEVRAAIGERAESAVLGFARLPTSNEGIAALARQASHWTEEQLDAVRVKMCELLDHMLDLGSVLFFRDWRQARAHFEAQGEDLCRLAARCDLPGLEADVRDAIRATLTAELPAELIDLEYPGDAKPLVIPRSCRRRPLYAVGRAVSRKVRQLASGFRPGG